MIPIRSSLREPRTEDILQWLKRRPEDFHCGSLIQVVKMTG